ncbi:MAG: type II CAAX prenyl endopeptidase Rce1 family protein [Promethearchaeota archaeon]
MFFTFCFGIILFYLYIKTKSLSPYIIAHYVNNALQLLLSYTTISNIPLSIILYIILISLIHIFLSFLIPNYFLNHEESR